VSEGSCWTITSQECCAGTRHGYGPKFTRQSRGSGCSPVLVHDQRSITAQCRQPAVPCSARFACATGRKDVRNAFCAHWTQRRAVTSGVDNGLVSALAKGLHCSRQARHIAAILAPAEGVRKKQECSPRAMPRNENEVEQHAARDLCHEKYLVLTHPRCHSRLDHRAERQQLVEAAELCARLKLGCPR